MRATIHPDDSASCREPSRQAPPLSAVSHAEQAASPARSTAVDCAAIIGLLLALLASPILFDLALATGFAR